MVGATAEAHARERFGWGAVAERHTALLRAARRSAVHALARGRPATFEAAAAGLETS